MGRNSKSSIGVYYAKHGKIKAMRRAYKVVLGVGWFQKDFLGLMGFEMHLEGGSHSAESQHCGIGSGWHFLLPTSTQCSALG